MSQRRSGSPTRGMSEWPPSQGYSHACQRAELLGLPTPTEEEWLASEERARDREAEEQEAQEDAIAQELEENEESMKRTRGGLDELNTILSATQKKITKFKTVCGSLGTLLKARVSASQPGTPVHKPRAGSSSEDRPRSSIGSETRYRDEEPGPEDEPRPDDDGHRRPPVAVAAAPAARKPAELDQKLGSHLDKLDSLINKAENAQYSMQHQTKQMKAFLK